MVQDVESGVALQALEHVPSTVVHLRPGMGQGRLECNDSQHLEIPNNQIYSIRCWFVCSLGLSARAKTL